MRDDDLLRRLDRQAIALWNLTTRLKRGWTAGESIAAQDGSRELLLLPIYSDTWLTAGTSDLTADGSTTTPNQHPVPLLRIFVFHVLDTVFRAGRSHSASAKQAHSERWKDTIRLLRVALKASRQCLEIHLLEHAIKILERAADCLDDLEKQQRVRTSSTIAGEEEQDRARMARDLRLEYLGLRMTLASPPLPRIWLQG